MLDKSEVKSMLESGQTLQQVADTFNVSKQRIGQIRKDLKLKTGTFGKAFVVQQKKATILQQQGVYWKQLGKTKASREDFDKQCYFIFTRKRQNAKHSKWEWDLNYTDVTFPSHCPILGIELDYFAERRAENSPSFDRIDPTKGYITGNVLVVSWRANRIKNDGSEEEHRKIADWLQSLTKR